MESLNFRPSRALPDVATLVLELFLPTCLWSGSACSVLEPPSGLRPHYTGRKVMIFDCIGCISKGLALAGNVAKSTFSER